MFKVLQKFLCSGKLSRKPKNQSIEYTCDLCHARFSKQKRLDRHRKKCTVLEFPKLENDTGDNDEKTPTSNGNQDSNFSDPKQTKENITMNGHHSEGANGVANEIVGLDMASNSSASVAAPSSIQIYFKDRNGKGSRIVIKESKLDEIIEKTKRLNYEQRCDVELKLISMYRKGKTRVTYGVAEEWMEKYEGYLNGTNAEFPGPINNDGLKKKLKKRMVPQNTYAVNELLWKFLQKLYGGGPEITYTEDLDSIMFPDSERSTGTTTNDTFRKSARSEFDDSRRTSLTDLAASLSPPNKPTSMPNSSLYCYMNSCLQALLSVPEFVEYLQQERYKHLITTQQPKFWPAMAEVVHAWEKRQPYFVPKGIKLLSINHFNPNEQHDAHEFLNFMLTGLQEEINPIQPHQKLSLNDSYSAWENYRRYHISIVDELFAGQMMSKVECLNCSSISVTFEPFLDLSLPIRKDANLSECLMSFQAEEEIINSYKCDNCMTQQRAIKKLSIERFPKILIIQLKRFQTHPIKAKRLDEIDFPVEQDWQLKPFKEYRRETYKYSLRAVISHTGPIDSGHYTCFSKRYGDWFLCNDEDIRKINPADIPKKDAYVLIYEQK